MKKLTLLMAVLIVAACTPQKLQTAVFADYKNGKPFYSMTGYTDLGETAPRSSVKYIEDALSDACPTGIKIDSLHESPVRNGAGQFLYWQAVAGCK